MRTVGIKAGYGIIQRDIMTMENLSIHSKAVYALLVSYAGQKNSCYPGFDTMAEKLDISRPTVIKAIKGLEDKELVRVERENGKGNTYYPTYIKDGEEPIVNNEPWFTLDGKLTYIGFNDKDLGKLDKKSNSIVLEGFWNLYDKKVDKVKTERMWKSMSEKNKAIVMTMIPWYKLAQPMKKYRKSPYSYLLNKCWGDEDLHGDAIENTKSKKLEGEW